MNNENMPLLFPDDDGEADIIDIALKTVREHFDMEVAYLSEFVDDRAVFRAVSAPGLEDLIAPGGTRDISDIYCQHILEGRLPNVMPDTLDEPLAAALPITHTAPIRSHVSVPVYREDGSVYGMFCCLSPRPNDTLNERDLSVMKTFSGLAQREIHSSLAKRGKREAVESSIDAIIEGNGLQIVLQPIFKVGSDTPCGFEALSRFKSDPYRPPNEWFDDARLVNRQIELEVAAIRKAVEILPSLPGHIYVAVNSSPATIASGAIWEVMQNTPVTRVVLEVTEHENAEGFDNFNAELKKISDLGIRIAIDDVGAGYSGLSHILRTLPQIIKLDMELVRNIDQDPARRSLTRALVHFKTGISCEIVAEGVETRDELECLVELGVDMVQGYYLGKPSDIASARSWFEAHAMAS
mgnify:CR=1 FL=1